MKVKCPSCGAVGTDVEPLSYERSPDAPPLPASTVRDMEAYGFEVYGNLNSRPVRKCLNCGAGIRVTFLPPRYRQLPDDVWEEHKLRFEDWAAADHERIRSDLETQPDVDPRVEDLTDLMRAHLLEIEQEAELEAQPVDPRVEDLANLVRAHFLEMEQEASGPRVYADWALRQLVKHRVIAEVTPEHIPAMVMALDDTSPKKDRYEDVLDDILEEEGLVLVAQDVLASVSYTSEDWERMSDDERRDALER